MARKGSPENMAKKIGALQSKIEKKKNEISTLKKSLEELVRKQNQSQIDEVANLAFKYGFSMSDLVETIKVTCKNNIPMSDVLQMVNDKVATN